MFVLKILVVLQMKINNELRNLIPPLTPEEYENLENSITEDGCRDSIITWNDTIVDGHNRYDICLKNNIKFNTIKKEFDDINQVKLWMINNQNGRRNLTDGWKFELAQSKKAILILKGKENLKTNIGGGQRLSTVDKGKEHNTQKELAKGLGWSSGKVAQADVVWQNAPKEVKEEIKKGEKTFNEAYKNIKKEERLGKIKLQRAEIEKEVLEKPKGKYDVIVIDPPWRYDGDIYKAQKDNLPTYEPEGFRGTAPYPTMSLEEIKNIKLPVKDDCVLWLWTTNLFLLDMGALLENWGFEIKSILTWDKEHFGTGRWLRSQTEHCILAIKGKPFFNNTKWGTLIREKRTIHSKKPEIFYTMVDEICAGRKLDYFARNKRAGWDVYGDEVL